MHKRIVIHIMFHFVFSELQTRYKEHVRRITRLQRDADVDIKNYKNYDRLEQLREMVRVRLSFSTSINRWQLVVHGESAVPLHLYVTDCAHICAHVVYICVRFVHLNAIPDLYLSVFSICLLYEHMQHIFIVRYGGDKCICNTLWLYRIFHGWFHHVL